MANKQNIALIDPSSHARKDIDIRRAFTLRYDKGLSYKDIGNLIGCSKQAIYAGLKPFQVMIDKGPQNDVYRNQAAEIFGALESSMVMCMINDMDKFKSESFYYQTQALKNIHGIRMLEEGRPSQIIETRNVNLSADLASFIGR